MTFWNLVQASMIPVPLECRIPAKAATRGWCCQVLLPASDVAWLPPTTSGVASEHPDNRTQANTSLGSCSQAWTSSVGSQLTCISTSWTLERVESHPRATFTTLQCRRSWFLFHDGNPLNSYSRFLCAHSSFPAKQHRKSFEYPYL